VQEVGGIWLAMNKNSGKKERRRTNARVYSVKGSGRAIKGPVKLFKRV
jgi:hypothetical protein